MQPSAPAPAQTWSTGTPCRSASASCSRYAPPSGYRLRSPAARAIASSAAGSGAERPLVGRELDHVLEAELALDVLDRASRLVRASAR